MIAKLRSFPDEQQIRLSAIPWRAYLAFCDGLGDRYLRVTYDHGEMEIMSVSAMHERQKKRLGRMVETLTEELDIDIVCGGSMTCRIEAVLRALEPDECYWIANESKVSGKDEIDLQSDPPPDLCLEIEISRSTLDRMPIYAALKVPEVWRWNADRLTIHVLGARANYRTSKRSRAFPFLPMDAFTAFLGRTNLTETKLIRAFREWIRENRAKWNV